MMNSSCSLSDFQTLNSNLLQAMDVHIVHESPRESLEHQEH